MDKIADVAGAIVTLAIIATLVASKNTQQDIAAIGKAFTDALKAAKGN